MATLKFDAWGAISHDIRGGVNALVRHESNVALRRYLRDCTFEFGSMLVEQLFETKEADSLPVGHALSLIGNLE